MRRYLLVLLGLVVLGAGMAEAAPLPAQAELRAELEALLEDALSLHGHLRELKEAARVVSPADVHEVQARLLEADRAIVELGQRLTELEHVYLDQVRPELIARATQSPVDRHVTQAMLQLLSIEELLVRSKGEIGTAWSQSSLIQLDLEMKSKERFAELSLVNAPPEARFSWCPVAPFTDQSVQFTDSSSDRDGQVVAWAWEFGDGTTSSQQHPAHQYARSGEYTVTLAVTDNDGATDIAQHAVLVVNRPPTACFTYEPDSPDTQDTVQFTDCSLDADGEVVGWQWEFGDGATSTERHPVHSYERSGVYTVALAVTDDEGATDTVKQTVIVGNVFPTACFTYEPETPGTLDVVEFTDCSTDPDGEVVFWEWEFGDGATSIERHPTHRYEQSGIYEVTLRVYDDECASDVIVHKVTVGNVPPTACFTYEPGEPTTQDVVEFTDCSTDVDGEVVAWEWEFGDGATSAEQHPRHQYARSGTYTVRLTVTDDEDATDDTTGDVVVRDAIGTLRVAPGEELTTIAGDAPRSVLLVLDASFSMRERVEGVPKIDIAKEALLELVEVMPDQLEVGLLVFKDCGLIDLVVPVSPLDRQRLVTEIQAVRPTGSTPIAGAIQLIPSALEGHPEPYLVVLVSDGMETCRGQPIQAARELMARGYELKMHVIGYDVERYADVQQQLRAIAAEAGGIYFSAETFDELRSALRLATPIRYLVFDDEETLVASGAVGDPAKELLAGRYTIVIETVQETFSVDVEVRGGVERTVWVDYIEGAFRTRVD